MGTRRFIAYCAGLLCLSFLLTSCHTAVVYKSKPAKYQVGPPPHAPAHGYRHKHADGVDLVYDRHLGVYIVAGYTKYYFYENRFFRIHRNVWQWSAHIKGPWKKASYSKVPKGLRNQKLAKGKSKKK